MLRLGFDVDGILADFNNSFYQVLACDIPKGYFPTVWDYPQKELGLSTAYVNSCWDKIKESHNFWSKLEELPGAYELYTFKHQHHKVPIEYYYITSRFGNTSLEQTKHWLTDHGLFEDASVIVSFDKGDVAKALKLDYYIDDRLENCLDVTNKMKKRAYLLNYPYNKKTTETEEAQVFRVFSVEEYLNDIRRYMEIL